MTTPPEYLRVKLSLRSWLAVAPKDSLIIPVLGGATFWSVAVVMAMQENWFSAATWFLIGPVWTYTMLSYGLKWFEMGLRANIYRKALLEEHDPTSTEDAV